MHRTRQCTNRRDRRSWKPSSRNVIPGWCVSTRPGFSKFRIRSLRPFRNDVRRMGGNNMTLFDLSGKVAVITGSSRGIGRAIAERMAEHGAKVVISSRKQAACDEVAKAINDRCGKQVALSVPANISTKDDLKQLVEETNRAFGKIDA